MARRSPGVARNDPRKKDEVDRSPYLTRPSQPPDRSKSWPGKDFAVLALSICFGGLGGLLFVDCSRKDAPIPAVVPSARPMPQQLSAASKDNHRPSIEFFNWWAKIGSTDGVEELLRIHRGRHPEDAILNATAGLSGNARNTLRDRMSRGDPPDVFQANIGRDVMQWVITNGIDAGETKLVALNRLIPDSAAEWRTAMPAALVAAASYDGELYSVPIRISRVNSLFYNKRIFKKYHIPPPTQLADLIAIKQRLKGTPITPLALGSRDPWTLALLIFEGLLVGREGPEFFESYFRGQLTPDDPRMVSTLEAAMELVAMTNPDHEELNWIQASDLVADGRAAMTVMGDWAAPNFLARGLREEEDYGEAAFPGSQGGFVYTADTFALPKGGKNNAGGARLLQTIGSKEVQDALFRAWGSLPARLDVPLPPDSLIQKRREHFQSGKPVLALSGLVPQRFADDVAQALAVMIREKSIDPVLHVLKSRYALLH